MARAAEMWQYYFSCFSWALEGPFVSLQIVALG